MRATSCLSARLPAFLPARLPACRSARLLGGDFAGAWGGVLGVDDHLQILVHMVQASKSLIEGHGAGTEFQKRLL